MKIKVQSEQLGNSTEPADGDIVAIRPDQIYISLQDVCALLGICRSTMNRLRRLEGFPACRSFGTAHRWRKSDILAWAEHQ